MYHTQIRICTLNLPTSQVIAKDSSISIKFYPQGASYFDGEQSLIAFHSKCSNGNSTSIKGELINDKNQVLQEVQSDANGRGSFTFFPQIAEKYHIRISQNDSLYTFPLPPRGESSLAVSVNNVPSKNIRFKVYSTPSAIKELYHAALFNSRGMLLLHSFSSDTSVSKVFVIPRSSLPKGINYAVAFDDAGEVQSVQPFYNYENSILQESIKLSSKLSKDNSGNTIISAQLLDSYGKGIKGDFSISIVAGRNKKFLSKDNIYTYINLMSELPFRLNTDTLYFNPNHSLYQQLFNIDNLLLTQTECYFPVRETVMDDVLGDYSKEFSQSISANLLSTTKKDNGYIITLFDPISEEVLIREIPNKKYFTIEDLDFPDARKFLLKVSNIKGKNRRIQWQPEPLADFFNYTSLYPILTNRISDDKQIADTITLNQIVGSDLADETLQGATIVEEGLIRPKSQLAPYNTTFEKHQVRTRKEIRPYDDMMIARYVAFSYPGFSVIGAGLVSNRSGVIRQGITNDKNGNPVQITLIGKEPVKLYVDGILVDWDALQGMTMQHVENLYVLRGNEAALYNTVGGVVLLELRHGGSIDNTNTYSNVHLVSPLGYSTDKYEDYFSPNTIYWNPNIVMDNNGNFSIKINSVFRYCGEYIIKIEGLTDGGKHICVVK